MYAKTDIAHRAKQELPLQIALRVFRWYGSGRITGYQII